MSCSCTTGNELPIPAATLPDSVCATVAYYFHEMVWKRLESALAKSGRLPGLRGCPGIAEPTKLALA